MLTQIEIKMLVPLLGDEHRNGRPAHAHRDAQKDVLSELARKGLVTLSGTRTGLAPEPDIWWVTITEAGREAVAPQMAE